MGKGKNTPHGVTWNLEITPQALAMLQSIKDARVRQIIIEAINGLAISPELKGKSLRGEFSDFRSVRSVGQRYRIIYRLNEGTITVLVVAVGLRREGDKADIYRLAQRLLNLGLLDAPTTPDDEGADG